MILQQQPARKVIDTQTVNSDAELKVVLEQLARASSYARDADRSRWDFAVEIASLTATGATTSELRWLVSKGYVEHACELTRAGDSQRRFAPCQRHLGFGPRTCFVLTEEGTELATSLTVGSVTNGASSATIRFSSALVASQEFRPTWDGDRRILSVANRIVKQYKVPSASQEAILVAFEEDCWPPAIDDPLPPHPQQDPKRRLRDTIRNLNTNQKSPLLRFRGDGTGCRVLWELVNSSLASPVTSARKRVDAA